jgi:hypothetical protein
MIPRGEPDFARDINRFVYFRKEFEVVGYVESAIVRASADGRYILYLNGARVGRGPARCHPGWQYVDPYDIAELIRPGRNVLAVLAHSYGRDTSFYELPRGAQGILFGCGGFYLEGSVSTEGGRVDLDSDGSWKFLASLAWESDTPFGGTGFEERYDAERAPDGWKDAGFDDSAWKSAHVQRIVLPTAGSDIVPFPRLVERDIGFLAETARVPLRVLPAASAATSAPHVSSFASADHAAADPAIFDFGGILCGRIAFELDAAAGSLVQIECAEALGPDGELFRPAAIPGISTPFVHRYRAREGRQSHCLFETAGFRYVRIGYASCVRPPKLISLFALESLYSGDDSLPAGGEGAARLAEASSTSPASRKSPGSRNRRNSGDFACSDGTLNALWKAGARTAAICRQDGLIDCPSREQRQWTGDPYIQALVNYVTLGDARLVRKYLLQSAQTQRADGMIMMASASDLGAEGRTFIPDFCLLWILAIEKYLLYTGDNSVLPELFPSVAKALAWFMPYIDGQGLLADTPGWIFIDWSERLERRGEVLALNALFIGALRSGARVARLAGAPLYARRWLSLARSLAVAADRRFWDEKRGLYADARGESGLSAVASQQGNAAAIAFGIAPAGRRASIFAAILDESRLKLTRTWRWDSERSFDPDRDIAIAQPFFSHFLHEALAVSGRVGDIVDNLKSRWGPMLAEGDTFRESWQLTEMTSRCHAFSATPTYDLSTRVLGPRPVADGFSRFHVAPYFAGLEWAKGAVPTPAGPIEVAWERRDASIGIEITVPQGISGELEIPGQAVPAGGGKRIVALLSGKNTLRVSCPP